VHVCSDHPSSISLAHAGGEAPAVADPEISKGEGGGLLKGGAHPQNRRKN
jgi:hypothetical protein